jgi:nucleotide-binding universal stress UspA family protein
MAGSKVETILAPTDLSPASKAGVRYALNAARKVKARVVIYRAIPASEIAAFSRERPEGLFVAARYNGLLEICQSRLRQFLNRNFADDLTSAEIKLKVEFDAPTKGIIGAAKAEGADVIIMSSSRTGRLRKMLFGSVTERVVRNAPCPVLMVPGNDWATARPED